ncbi:hypothetical protein D3C87_1367300 [compost metagenome]
MVAEAAVVLDRQVDPRQQVALAVERGVDVQVAPIAIPGASAETQGAEGFGLGALGDDIDQATGVATTVEAGSRPLEYFNALDVGGIRRAVAATVDGEAVLVQLARGEATYAVVEKGQAAEVVLSRYATGEIQGAVDAGGIKVLNHLGGNDVDALRGVTDVRVGAGGRGRASGAIATHRPVGALLDK